MGTLQILNGGLNVNNKLLVDEYGQIVTQLTVGSGGGFAYGHGWKINGNYLGQFGLYGSDTSANYFYFGTDYLDPWMSISPDGTVTATKFVGSLQGNAATASKLAIARTISLTGSVTGSGSFDGSGNLSISTTTNHTHSYLPLSGGTVSGTIAATSFFSSEGYYSGQNGTTGLVLLDPSASAYYNVGVEPEDNNTYRIALIKKISSISKYNNEATFISRYWPNSYGFLFGNIYSTNDLNSDGLPRYSTMLGSNLGGNMVIFGTSSFNFYAYSFLHSGNYSHYALPIEGGTLTGALNLGSSLKLWSDNEGGNIRITSGNGHTNCWEMDSYNGNLRLYTYKESDGTYISTTLDQETGCWSTAHRSIRTSYDGGNTLYAGWSNEINFGGTSSSNIIYFGYRAMDSKPIPMEFIFGGGDGSANLTAKSLANVGRSVPWINGRDSALVKFTSYSGYNAITSMKTTNGAWEMGVYTDNNMYFTYTPDSYYNAGTNSGYSQVRINSSAEIFANKVYGAVWNDYAEFRNQDEEIEPGYCVASNNNGKVYKTNQHLQACDGIVSDTYGFSIGETDNCKTPLAVSGRVLAYYEGNKYDYNAGDTVGASANGKIIKMTREEITKYPDRIVGIVSEIPEYDTWGTGNISTAERIWIKVK